MAFNFFPGGNKREIAEEALDIAVKDEKALRDAVVRAGQVRANLQSNPPTYFNAFQLGLALEQADEDLRYFTTLLAHAQRKLAWEKDKKWRTK